MPSPGPNSALVVDDNPHACRLLSSVLSALLGGEVRTCTCPSKAYKILQDWQPGVILTDFQMAPINGLAFASELRANPAFGFRLKPILLMTAETPNQALVEQVKAAGVDAMVTKPIVPEALAARLEWARQAAKERAATAKAEIDSATGIWLVD